MAFEDMFAQSVRDFFSSGGTTGAPAWSPTWTTPTWEQISAPIATLPSISSVFSTPNLTGINNAGNIELKKIADQVLTAPVTVEVQKIKLVGSDELTSTLDKSRKALESLLAQLPQSAKRIDDVAIPAEILAAFANPNMTPSALNTIIEKNRTNLIDYLDRAYSNMEGSITDMNDKSKTTLNTLKENAEEALKAAKSQEQVELIKNIYTGKDGLIPLASAIHEQTVEGIGKAVLTKVNGVTRISNAVNDDLDGMVVENGVVKLGAGEQARTVVIGGGKKETYKIGEGMKQPIKIGYTPPEKEMPTITVTREAVSEITPTTTGPEKLPGMPPGPEKAVRPPIKSMMPELKPERPPIKSIMPELPDPSQYKGNFEVRIGNNPLWGGTKTFHVPDMATGMNILNEYEQFMLKNSDTKTQWANPTTVWVKGIDSSGEHDHTETWGKPAGESKAVPVINNDGSKSYMLESQTVKLVDKNDKTYYIPITDYKKSQAWIKTNPTQVTLGNLLTARMDAQKAMTNEEKANAILDQTGIQFKPEALQPPTGKIEVTREEHIPAYEELGWLPEPAKQVLREIGGIIKPRNERAVDNGLLKITLTPKGEKTDVLKELLGLGVEAGISPISSLQRAATLVTAIDVASTTGESVDTALSTEKNYEVGDRAKFNGLIDQLKTNGKITNPGTGLTETDAEDLIIEFATPEQLKEIAESQPKWTAIHASNPLHITDMTAKLGQNEINRAFDRSTITDTEMANVGLGTVWEAARTVTEGPFSNPLANAAVFVLGGGVTGELGGALKVAKPIGTLTAEAARNTKVIQGISDAYQGIKATGEIKVPMKVLTEGGGIGDVLGEAMIRNLPEGKSLILTSANTGDIAKTFTQLSPLDQGMTATLTKDINNKMLAATGSDKDTLAVIRDTLMPAQQKNSEMLNQALAELALTNPEDTQKMLRYNLATTPEEKKAIGSMITGMNNALTGNIDTLAKALRGADEPIVMTNTLMKQFGAEPFESMAEIAYNDGEPIIAEALDAWTSAQRIDRDLALKPTIEKITPSTTWKPGEFNVPETFSWSKWTTPEDIRKVYEFRAGQAKKYYPYASTSMTDNELIDLSNLNRARSKPGEAAPVTIVTVDPASIDYVNVGEAFKDKRTGVYVVPTSKDVDKGTVNVRLATPDDMDIALQKVRIKMRETPTGLELGTETPPMETGASELVEETVEMGPGGPEIEKTLTSKTNVEEYISEKSAIPKAGVEPLEKPIIEKGEEGYPVLVETPEGKFVPKELGTKEMGQFEAQRARKALIDEKYNEITPLIAKLTDDQKTSVYQALNYGALEPDDADNIVKILKDPSIDADARKKIATALDETSTQVITGIKYSDMGEVTTPFTSLVRQKAGQRTIVTGLEEGQPFTTRYSTTNVKFSDYLTKKEEEEAKAVSAAAAMMERAVPTAGVTRTMIGRTGALTTTDVTKALEEVTVGKFDTANEVLNRITNTKILDNVGRTNADLMKNVKAVDIEKLRSAGVKDNVVNKLIDMRSSQASKDLEGMGNTGRTIARKIRDDMPLTTEELSWAMKDRETLQTVTDSSWTKFGKKNILAEARQDIADRLASGKLTPDDALKELDDIEKADPWEREILC